MQLECPRCGQAIAGADIDIARGIGVCRPCGELVPFPQLGPSPPLATYVPSQAPMIYRPESFRFVERQQDTGYVAEMPPNRVAALPVVFFSVFWNGFMLVWYTIAIVGHIWPMALFGVIHLAVGLFMAHKALVQLLNTRRFVIEASRVRVMSGPVPVRGAFDAEVTSIDSFVVRAKSSSSRNGTSTVTSFALVANMGSGESKELAVAFDDEPSAAFAVQRMNDELLAAKARSPQLPYRS